MEMFGWALVGLMTGLLTKWAVKRWKVEVWWREKIRRDKRW
jgi:hypothetical protein